MVYMRYVLYHAAMSLRRLFGMEDIGHPSGIDQIHPNFDGMSWNTKSAALGIIALLSTSPSCFKC